STGFESAARAGTPRHAIKQARRARFIRSPEEGRLHAEVPRHLSSIVENQEDQSGRLLLLRPAYHLSAGFASGICAPTCLRQLASTCCMARALSRCDAARLSFSPTSVFKLYSSSRPSSKYSMSLRSPWRTIP